MRRTRLTQRSGARSLAVFGRFGRVTKAIIERVRLPGRGERIVIRTGEAVDLTHLRAKTERLTLNRRAADRILADILELGLRARNGAQKRMVPTVKVFPFLVSRRVNDLRR